MAKCPLCGSDGDDLVFRFYCSANACANYAPPKEEKEAPNWDIMPFRIKEMRRKPMTLPKGEIFHLGSPKFLGSFPVREDAQIEPMMPSRYTKEISAEFELMREQIFAAMGVPKAFFGHDDDQRIPCFDLAYDPSAHQLRLTWHDRVPNALNMFVEPILTEHLGMPMLDHVKRAISDKVTHCLLRMCDLRELVWNRTRNRWELHFTE